MTARHALLLAVALGLPTAGLAADRAATDAEAAPAPTPAAPDARARRDLSLAQAWVATLDNDPSYQAAISQREAGQAERAMGRAGLLPQINASASRSKVRGTLDSPGLGGTTVRQDLRYTSQVAEVRVSQTLFDWGRVAEYRRGQARADLALAVFDTQVNDTASRLVNRYFQVLLDVENINITRNRVAANATMVKAAQRRFDAGEGTITEIREAESRHDISRADLIAARDALVVSVEELQEMVGRTPLRLFRLKADFVPGALAPETLEGWMTLALGENADIRTGFQNLRVAQTEVQRSLAGHLPTVEAVAARRHTEGETITTRDQKSRSTTWGIQASVPIFSGGRTQAQYNQARHNRERSRHELDATHHEVMVEVTRQYQAVIGGVERIAALKKAVGSSEQALVATQRGFEGGTRTMVDVLDAQDLLFQARMDLMQARLQYIVARLLLASAAGRLDQPLMDATTAEYFGDTPVEVG